MNTRGRVAVFQGVLTVAAEHQPIGVQVVEWVGLVASGFQFLLGLGAVLRNKSTIISRLFLMAKSRGV